MGECKLWMWYDPQPCKIKALLLLADWLKLIVQPGEAFVGSMAGNICPSHPTENKEKLTYNSYVIWRISNHNQIELGKLVIDQ